MPDQYTLEEFGQRIKAKYPQYKDLPDAELAQKVLAKYPQYKSSVVQSPAGDWRDPLTRTEMHQPIHSASDLGREVVRGVGNIGAGGLGVILRPIATAEGIASTFRHPLDTASNIADQTLEHPLETVETFLGQAAAFDLAGKPIGPATRALKNTSETIRKGAQASVGAGSKAVKHTVAGEAEASNAAREKTLAANKSADESTLEARGKVDEANAAQREAESKTKRDTIATNRSAAAKNEQETAETRAANKEAMRAQEKIQPTQAKLLAAGRELQAQIETAREKARAVGDTKYSGVNEKLSHFPADMESVHRLYLDASNSIGEVQAEPSVLGRLGKALEHGESLTYKDEQALYSELGKELSKGTLPGGTYHAYDLLHEGLGADMQRIADSQNMGAQLTDARTYWRRMKQTFGKPYNPTDAGNVTLEKSTGASSTEEQANRVRLLSSFDPSIAGTVEHIGNLRKGLDALPKEQPVRDVVKPLPAKPQAAPLPKPGEPKPYAEPKGTKPIEVPEVNTRKIREQLVDRWARGEEGLNKWQVRALIAGPIGGIIGFLVGHGEAGAGLGYGLGTAIGPAIVANLVERPAIREWLTRPPATELATLQSLPYADRIRIVDGLKQVASVAQKTGTRISPLLSSFLSTAALGPKAQELRKIRDQQRQAVQ